MGAGGEGDDKGWDGWMASLTWWTWVWVNFRIWWWTGRPGLLQFMGSQKVGHDWATELNWTECSTVCVRAQSGPTLCNPMDCSLPGSSVHGISQARILEWVAISFSRGSSQTRDRTWVPCIAGKFFTIWAIRGLHSIMYACINTQVHTHIYVYQLSADGHLGCFYILAIVNDTAVNIEL